MMEFSSADEEYAVQFGKEKGILLQDGEYIEISVGTKTVFMQCFLSNLQYAGTLSDLDLIAKTTIDTIYNYMDDWSEMVVPLFIYPLATLILYPALNLIQEEFFPQLSKEDVVAKMTIYLIKQATLRTLPSRGVIESEEIQNVDILLTEAFEEAEKEMREKERKDFEAK